MNNIDSDAVLNSTRADSDSLINDHNPYAGPKPFQEIDEKFFFGREREISELTRLIGNNTLTVVFGKSGMGKTSLLQAGLVPWVRKNYYLPVIIRIDFNDPKESPVEQVKKALNQLLNKINLPIPEVLDKTLWEFFYDWSTFNKILCPLLIFDQLEEMFTAENKNIQAINAFITEIADLIENQAPAIVQERLFKENQPIYHLGKQASFRVIFSLREDYLAELESLCGKIPSISASRLRIGPMSEDDAIAAIEKPAKGLIKSREVTLEIIKLFPESEEPEYHEHKSTAKSGKSRIIDPFLLSLFCYKANIKRLDKVQEEISLDLVRGIAFHDILRNFYEESVQDCPPVVPIVLENFLVSEGEHRWFQAKELLKAKSDYHLTDAVINTLIDRRLIRKETRGGVEYIELIHDLLAPILYASRERRIEAARQIREAEQGKKKRRRRIVLTVSTVCVILFVLTGILLNQRSIAESNKQQAIEAKKNEAKAMQDTIKKEKQRIAYELAAYSIDVRKKNEELSFRLAESAFYSERNNQVVQRALLSVFYGGTFYKKYSDQLGKEFLEMTSKKQDFFAIFSPTGNKILTVNSTRAALWKKGGYKLIKDRENPKPKEQPENFQFRTNAAFSPDDNYIAICTNDDNYIFVWNLLTDEPNRVRIEGQVNSIAFSPGIEHITLIAACRDKTIRILELDGTLFDEAFKGHTDEVTIALPYEEGRKIVSASLDKTVRLWNVEGREPFGQSFTVPEYVVYAAVSQDGASILCATRDGQVMLFDGNLKPMGAWQPGNYVAFSPDDAAKFRLIASEDQTSRLITKTNFIMIEWDKIGDALNNISFSSDGKYVLIATKQGPAQLRPVDPEEIIAIGNQVLKVRPLTEVERKTYNVPSPNK
jgi:hypothetical protein